MKHETWRCAETDPPPEAEAVLVTDGNVYAVADLLGKEWEESNTEDHLWHWTSGGKEKWTPTHWMNLPNSP
jgi:hypothetical protein